MANSSTQGTDHITSTANECCTTKNISSSQNLSNCITWHGGRAILDIQVKQVLFIKVVDFFDAHMGQQKHGIRSGDRLQITEHARRELPDGSKLIHLTQQESALLLTATNSRRVRLELLVLCLGQTPEGSQSHQGPSTWSQWSGTTQHLPMPTLRATGVLRKGSALQGLGHSWGCSWFKCPQNI